MDGMQIQHHPALGRGLSGVMTHIAMFKGNNRCWDVHTPWISCSLTMGTYCGWKKSCTSWWWFVPLKSHHIFSVFHSRIFSIWCKISSINSMLSIVWMPRGQPGPQFQSGEPPFAQAEHSVGLHPGTWFPVDPGEDWDKTRPANVER